MVLTLYEIEKMIPKDIRKIYGLMPRDRQIKFDGYRFDKDRRLCAAAYILLLYGIYLADGVLCRKLQFTYGKYGKPALIGFPNLHFNLTHCSRGVACAISRTAIGIDIQNIDEYDASLVRTVMSPEEQQIISESRIPEVMFMRIWTCKESYLKFVGTGIDDDLAKLSFPQRENRFYANNCYFSLNEHAGCVISLCESTCAYHRTINLDANMITDFLSKI